MDFRIEWNEQLERELERAAKEVVKEGADIVLADCNPPVKSGKLKDSGHVEVWPDKARAPAGASVVYDAPHAHLVHELPGGHHLENGEDKWVEKAATRKRNEVLRLFESKMMGVLNENG
ncbi:HK97 gp10 family phage protein [Tumebacillus permanentifrigoris]|uniref:Uncharacterized protein n=1 Tax=Tumebacillus permanentifrigoris TaxID=378543 RepID=A0A316D3I9_9BACL|nr:HK97 gp10 family phage protein [Tumebacillus permanentifrigoris]PWK05304.1 hypothetical protein C7459_12453 [Tumebacillus permanentifrigoris]